MSEAPLSAEPRTVKAVETTCEIIDALKKLDGAGVTELSNYLDRSKASVYSHLATLKQGELVKKEGGEYNLSFRFLGISEHIKNQSRIYEAARKKVDELAKVTNTRVQLVIEEYGMAVCVYVARADHSVRSHTGIGERGYLHSTASGKAILALLSQEHIEEIIDKRGLPEVTPNTITDRQALYDELKEVQETGIAFNDEESLIGLQGIGAPIKCPNMSVSGAISVSKPMSGLQGNQLNDNIVESLINTVNVVEVNMQVL